MFRAERVGVETAEHLSGRQAESNSTRVLWKARIDRQDKTPCGIRVAIKTDASAYSDGKTSKEIPSFIDQTLSHRFVGDRI